MVKKFVKGVVIAALIIFSFVLVAVQPASATQPEEFNITVNHIYRVPTGSTTFGTWESSGVLGSSGDIYETYFWAGWNDDGWFVKNLHTTIILSDSNGTIKIKAHAKEEDFEPYGLLDLEGNWVIVGGTGEYTGLHGQGKTSFSGMFYWDCPPNDYNIMGPCIVTTETYTGEGHVDP